MNLIVIRPRFFPTSQLLAFICTSFAVSLAAAPPGPMPQIPDGGTAPGPFPNTSVTAVNVIARGSNQFNSSVDVPGFDGQGPIRWSLNRYNRGDFAMRLAPADPVAALGNLGQGFIEFGDNSATVPANHAWHPQRPFGVIIPTARQNGPINWNDNEGPFFPTVAVSWASSGPGYRMTDGSFGTGDLDINTGRAGTHASSPEANFSFSATWFPYDQGWLGGEVGVPIVGDFTGTFPDGSAQWQLPDAHAAGLSANLIKWTEFPPFTATYGGLAELRLPGVHSIDDGMLFATSSDGSSDVNIVGVAPLADGTAWIITIREDSDTTAETLATGSQSRFQFVYIPFDAQRLVGGYISGANASKLKAAGDFTIARTAPGTYEMTIPGKSGTDGALILQAAALEQGTILPLATRAFLSCEFRDGKFIIQSRKTTTATSADLADVDFYVAWIDFANPLAPPDGPRFRALPPAVASPEGVIAREAGVGVNIEQPEILVTTIDASNLGFHIDPETQQFGLSALVGRFYDPRTLTPTSEIFPIIVNPAGAMSRHDIKYNPISKQYNVVVNTRTRTPAGLNVPTIAIVNSQALAPGGNYVAKTFVHDIETPRNYDDMAIAVNTGNGDFLVVAEYSFENEGEGAVGMLFNKDGTALSTLQSRLDRLQSVGDEDDPDVIYDSSRNVYIYISNTDNSNGSTGTLSNRVVGSVVLPTPAADGSLQTQLEQVIGDGLPSRPEGHPASMVNPFNGELITVYDAGNNQPNGDIAYTSIGAAPAFLFTPARPEIPYNVGSAGNPFNHQHPQLDADPLSGVIVVGFNATGSSAGLPEGYVFVALGPDGAPLPSQLGLPYFLTGAPGGIGNTVNYHNIRFSPQSGSFIATYNTGPGVTFVTALQVTSLHLARTIPPQLGIQYAAGSVVLSWPESASSFNLQSTTSLSSPAWGTVSTPPTTDAGLLKVTVPPTGSAAFYRLSQP